MTKRALLIIDVQYDFLPGGSLAVVEGDLIIPLINTLRDKVKWDLIALSQDWHPKGHKSFSSSWEGKTDIHDKPIVPGNIHVINLRGGVEEWLWPDHCVQGSHGAEFNGRLHVEPSDIIVKKGTNPEIDSYSAFADNHKSSITELYKVLDQHNITDAYVCGIATDFCVNFTCQDARVRRDDATKAPYNTHLILDACRGVSKEGSEKAVQALREAPFNVHVTNTDEVIRTLA